MEQEFNEIFKLASKNHFLFIYTKNEDEDNFVKYDLSESKEIHINISDQKDLNLNQLLKEKLKELEDRLK